MLAHTLSCSVCTRLTDALDIVRKDKMLMAYQPWLGLVFSPLTVEKLVAFHERCIDVGVT